MFWPLGSYRKASVCNYNGNNDMQLKFSSGTEIVEYIEKIVGDEAGEGGANARTGTRRQNVLICRFKIAADYVIDLQVHSNKN